MPPNLVECFHDVTGLSRKDYFCTSDPIGAKLGSGGGTNWLMKEAYESEAGSSGDFNQWLSREKRILLHAGGQSRRLPSYAPSGKILTPIPVFRWERGQRIGQNLLQLQLPLYRRIMEAAPKGLNTLIASGDVYIRAGKLQQIPEADIVCYGLWAEPSLAKNHGVFFSRRETPEVLDFVLQKPDTDRLQELRQSHLFLMDIGIWLLSDRAVRLLMKKSTGPDGEITNYDLYGDFGQALGQNPTCTDPELNSLSVAVLPLQDGEFYHYGTSREMISSTMAIQNLVYDQRAIMHLGVKAHPSIFTQNTHNEVHFTPENQNTWIENSWVGRGWTLSHENIITGVPCNNWTVSLKPSQCIDIVPIGEDEWVLRPYGFNDTMRGDMRAPSTTYLGIPVTDWLRGHNLTADAIEGSHDIQSARIFPVCKDIQAMEQCLHWMLDKTEMPDPVEQGLATRYLSANEISDFANLRRLQEQRMSFRKENLTALSRNHRSSIFYQTNLDDLAHEFHTLDVPLPAPLDDSEPLLKRINDQMFRSRLKELNTASGKTQDGNGNAESSQAFSLLREGLTQDVLSCRQMPRLDVYSDQIVWGRSPVRIDLAGGWTDTPPYCLTSGGNVVNIAIELNGQPPLQVYVKPCKEYKIILRSIDLGASEELTTWEELRDFARVGSYGIPEFRLPKAIVQKEIDTLAQLGVKIETNTVIGKTISIDEIFQQGYEAIFIGSGAGLPRFMNIPGENLNGVYSANEFLTRVNLMKAYQEHSRTPIQHASKVAVVGGGNVAMDAARSALRLGASEVYIVYRRSENELPARAEEVEHAKEEGVVFKLLTNPVEILSDDDGKVRGIRCIQMELGEPDASGRRRPVEKPGSEFEIEVDSVIMAIGTSPNPLIKNTTEGLETGRGGVITADEITGQTSREGVFAGGDAVTGAATVILAMGAGKNAAAAIDGYIKHKK